jgi:hypothetical protein
VLGALGTDVPALLRSARIRASELERPDGMLTLRQVEALIRHCRGRAIPVPISGFEFGRAHAAQRARRPGLRLS